MIKTINEILKEFNNKVFLWADDKTLDIVIDDNSKQFIEIILNYKCLRCDNNIINGNEKLCKDINEDVRGIEIICKSCKQKWFIHEKFTNIF